MVLQNVSIGHMRVEGIPSPHLHFIILSQKKEQILKEHTSTESTLPFEFDEMYATMREFPRAVDYIHAYSVYDTDVSLLTCPIFYKLGQDGITIKFIKDYVHTHLLNSLTKELLSFDNLKKTTKWIVYMLYYYRLFRTETVDDLKSAVISDLADMIGLIIKRENTLYKSFNTTVAIDSLRWAHKTAKLMEMGHAPSNINLRRRA